VTFSDDGATCPKYCGKFAVINVSSYVVPRPCPARNRTSGIFQLYCNAHLTPGSSRHHKCEADGLVLSSRSRPGVCQQRTATVWYEQVSQALWSRCGCHVPNSQQRSAQCRIKPDHRYGGYVHPPPVSILCNRRLA